MLKPAINWTKVIFFSFSAIKKTSLVFSSSQDVKADADDGVGTAVADAVPRGTSAGFVVFIPAPSLLHEADEEEDEDEE